MPSRARNPTTAPHGLCNLYNLRKLVQRAQTSQVPHSRSSAESCHPRRWRHFARAVGQTSSSIDGVMCVSRCTATNRPRCSWRLPVTYVLLVWGPTYAASGGMADNYADGMARHFRDWRASDCRLIPQRLTDRQTVGRMTNAERIIVRTRLTLQYVCAHGLPTLDLHDSSILHLRTSHMRAVSNFDETTRSTTFGQAPLPGLCILGWRARATRFGLEMNDVVGWTVSLAGIAIFLIVARLSVKPAVTFASACQGAMMTRRALFAHRGGRM